MQSSLSPQVRHSRFAQGLQVRTNRVSLPSYRTAHPSHFGLFWLLTFVE